MSLHRRIEKKIKIVMEIDATARLNGINVSAPQAIRTNEIGIGNQLGRTSVKRKGQN